MKYENKKRKMLLISISVIVISLSLLLYKTFSSFIKKTEFPITNDNVNFAFYKKGESTDTMPEKGNSENLGFDPMSLT